MTFVIKQFHNTQSLGEKLSQMRKLSHLTLGDCEAKTKIQKKYIKAFEKNDFSVFPDLRIAKQYLKQYVQFFGANTPYFLDQFDQEYKTNNPSNTSLNLIQKTTKKAFLSSVQVLRFFGFLFLFAIISFYLFNQIQRIVKPPELIIYEPNEGTVSEKPKMIIAGKTEKEARVKINGEHVLLNSDHTFQKEVSLNQGLNLLLIEGSKRYSKPKTIFLRVIFENQNTNSQQKIPQTQIP